MVYEVNLKLRFLPTNREIANRTSVHTRAYSTLRHKGSQCSARTVASSQKTLKTKNKI